MVNISIRADDVVLATKKTVVKADRQVKIKVPSYATDRGRAKTCAFDVGKEGQAELERMQKAVQKKLADIDERANKDRVEAWRPIVELEQRIRDARTEQKGSARSKAAAPGARDDAQDSATEQDDAGSSHSPEADSEH